MKKWILAIVMALGVSAHAHAQPLGNYKLETIVEGLDGPWGLAILPNGDMLVTELTGDLRLIRNGKLVGQAVAGVPESLYGGQGGLMDIALHPGLCPKPSGLSVAFCRHTKRQFAAGHSWPLYRHGAGRHQHRVRKRPDQKYQSALWRAHGVLCPIIRC